MPSEREWREPEIACAFLKVVVHHTYLDDDYDAQSAVIYAIYEPVRHGADGRPQFDIDECDEPIEEFDIRDLMPLVGASNDTYKGSHHDLLKKLIDYGFITQKGAVTEPDGHKQRLVEERAKKLSIALPFDELRPDPVIDTIFPGK
jgi:hypothetical protein